MNFFAHFLLLVWKNFKLQRRHPFTTLFELLLPVFIGVILIFIRVITNIQSDSNTTATHAAIPISNFSQINLPDEIYFCPKTIANQDFMDRLAKDLKGIKEKTTVFKNEQELITYYKGFENLTRKKNIIAVILGILNTDPVVYTMRPIGDWKITQIYPSYQTVDPKYLTEMAPDYVKTGFLKVQHAVGLVIAEINAGKEEFKDIVPYMYLQKFPSSGGPQDTFLNDINFYFPFAIILSFMFPCISIVKSLVYEKEHKLKVFMKLNGLSPVLNNFTWFIQYVFHFSLICFLLLLLLIIHVRPKIAIFTRSDPSFLLFILMIYSGVTICFAFFMYSIFDDARSASVATPLIYFLATVPYMFIFHRYQRLSTFLKIVWGFIFNTAISLVFNIIIDWENKGVGFHWEYIALTATGNVAILCYLLFFLIVEAFLFLVAAWYIKRVFPDEYTIPEVWYFPFTDAYWSQSPLEGTGGTKHIQFSFDYQRMEYFETEPIHFQQTIRIRSLTHVYPSKTTEAIRDIFLNIYEGQVTVFLGQKGSGKTTILSILMGLFPPTSGYVLINNMNVVYDMKKISSHIGICLQQNVQFDDLTVEEHLYFFAQLKRYSSNLITTNVVELIQNLELEHVSQILVRDLTNDEKRRLAIAIAFVGESSIIFLDEPTATMDSASRGKIWNFIKTQRTKCTIVLATQYLEEADIVGDRIAILANGEIQCCGSPLFLNKKYGVGYHLNVTKGQNCDDFVIADIVRSYVPEAELCKDVDTKIVFILPRTATDKFQKLFAHLEQNHNKLSIVNFGASVITMEEIFKTVGQSGEDTKDVDSDRNSDDGSFQDFIGADSGDSPSPKDAIRKNSGCDLLTQHFFALLIKHVLFCLKNWRVTLLQYLIGPFLLTLVLLALYTLPKIQQETKTKLALNLDVFENVEIPYEVIPASSTDNLVEDFRMIVNNKANNAKQVTNLSDYLIRMSTKDSLFYSRRIPVAASFNLGKKKSLTILYNDRAYHTPAIAIWIIDTLLLKRGTGERKRFLVNLEPLPKFDDEMAIKNDVDFTGAFQISLAVVVGFSVLVSNFLNILVKELDTKSKFLQIIGGTTATVYWSVTFLWHYICYIFVCMLSTFPFLLFNTSGMSSFTQQGCIFFLFAIHGLAYIPLAYYLLYQFKEPTHAAASIGMMNIMIVAVSLLILTLTNVPRLGLQGSFSVLDWIFSLLIPTYNLGKGVSNMYQNQQVKDVCRNAVMKKKCLESANHFCCKEVCGDMCIKWTDSYFDFEYPGIGKHILCLVIQFILFIVILAAVKLGFVDRLKAILQRRAKYRHSNYMAYSYFAEDEEVTVERHQILLTPLANLQENHVLIAKELSKSYGLHLAVNKVTLGVNKGECFGILGTNSSGKTSILQMLVGHTSMTSGCAYIDGHNLDIDLRKAQQKIGYCPQIDALMEQFTGEETLYFYCRLRGIPEQFISPYIKKISSTLMLSDNLKIQIKDYSDSAKRKLSVAIALIGKPPIVFLDEPTSHMDIASRRCTWNMLIDAIRNGQSILIVTNSMEECETLCHRLAIIINGKLTCLGNPQELGYKFGKCFTLLINVGRIKTVKHRPILVKKSSKARKLPLSICGHPEHQGKVCPVIIEEEKQFKEDIEKVKKFISGHIPGSILKDAYEGFLQYHVRDSNFNWSEMFRLMEMAKHTLNITDYSVGQTTMQQILLTSLHAKKM